MIAFAMPLSSQCIAAQICKSLFELVENIHIRYARIKTSRLLGNRLTASHYSKDLYTIFELLQSERFTRLHKLELIVDTPAFAIGNGERCQYLRRASPKLRHFSLEYPLSQQLHSRLSLSAPALTQMLQSMRNLLTLHVSDVHNLGQGFFTMTRCMKGLKTLSLSRCSCIPSFVSEFDSLGLITGSSMPKDLTSLRFGVTNLYRALQNAFSYAQPPLFLSTMKSLVHLELEESAESLTRDIWYFLRSIDGFGVTLLSFQSPSRPLCALFDFAQDLMGKETLRFKTYHENKSKSS